MSLITDLFSSTVREKFLSDKKYMYCVYRAFLYSYLYWSNVETL